MRVNWGTGIALVYTMFAVATSGFVVFAMNRRVDLVSDDYYEQSLRLDERMAAERNAAALTPGPSIGLDGPRTLTIAIPTSSAAGASGRLTMYRASDAREDRQVTLRLDDSGRQAVPLDGLAAGQWVVQVEWTSGGRPYYVEAPIVLP